MDTWSTFPLSDRADISRWFGAGTARDALALSRSFTFLHWGHGYLNGILQDTQGERYEVGAVFSRDGGNDAGFKADCTCRDANAKCKHVAALLLAALEQKSPIREQPVAAPARLSPALSAWLEEFRAHATAVDTASHQASKAGQALAYVIAWSHYPSCYQVRFHKARLAADGSLRSIGDPWHNIEAALDKPPKFAG